MLIGTRAYEWLGDPQAGKSHSESFSDQRPHDGWPWRLNMTQWEHISGFRHRCQGAPCSSVAKHIQPIEHFDGTVIFPDSCNMRNARQNPLWIGQFCQTR